MPFGYIVESHLLRQAFPDLIDQFQPVGNTEFVDGPIRPCSPTCESPRAAGFPLYCADRRLEMQALRLAQHDRGIFGEDRVDVGPAAPLVAGQLSQTRQHFNVPMVVRQRVVMKRG